MLSIFTTTTNPDLRGDNWRDAINCYNELADEVVVIDGKYDWPKEFSWPCIGEHFQKGYDKCKGDWVIRCDLDYIFHEKDFADIRKAIDKYNDYPALSFWKYQFILPYKYNLKSRLVLAINKAKCGDRIKFDSGGDLCQPSLDGKEITSVPEARVPFYNYEHILKTKAQITDDVGRMDRAYHRHFGEWLYSKDGTNSFDGWYEMIKSRYNKPSEPIALSKHPKFVQNTIKNLRPDQFGYSGFGMGDNNYAG